MGTVFWCHTYSGWGQIHLPKDTAFSRSAGASGNHNPSLALDYHRFYSDSVFDFMKFQVARLRKHSPGKAITENEIGLLVDQVDYSKLYSILDCVSWDNYPMSFRNFSDYGRVSLSHDLMRGAKRKKNFMVMEQEAGIWGWGIFGSRQAAPGLYQVWTYQSVAHGADGICFFNWRAARHGVEQTWQGILHQDSYPNARYKVVAQVGKEVGQLTDLLHGSQVVSSVAVMVSPDSRWALQIQRLSHAGINYDQQLRNFSDALRRRGVNVDVIFPQEDLSAYKVIVAPAILVVHPPLA